jgi:hypothetical protein
MRVTFAVGTQHLISCWNDARVLTAAAGTVARKRY